MPLSNPKIMKLRRQHRLEVLRLDGRNCCLAGEHDGEGVTQLHVDIPRGGEHHVVLHVICHH